MIMDRANRLASFDLLKLFAIFLVLWGHCIQHLFSLEPKENIVYIGIYTFHMPLFMMIAGYFSRKTLKVRFTTFLLKKAQQLLLPCLSFGLMTWCLWSLIFYVIHGDYPLLGELVSTIGNNYWFLKSLFCCYLLAWCGQHSGLKFYYWFLITLVISQFISLYNLRLMYPAFVIGLLIRENQWLMSIIKSKSGLLFIVFMVLGLLFGKFIWDYYAIRILLGLLGAIALVGVGTKYLERFASNNFSLRLCNIGRQTLGIYLLQGLILESILPVLINFNKINIWLFTLVVSPLISLAILLLCSQILQILSKSNVLAFCFLGQRKV